MEGGPFPEITIVSSVGEASLAGHGSIDAVVARDHRAQLPNEELVNWKPLEALPTVVQTVEFIEELVEKRSEPLPVKVTEVCYVGNVDNVRPPTTTTIQQRLPRNECLPED